MHTVHINEVTRLLEEGLQKLPSTALSAMEVFNSTSDPQRNRRLELACRYYAQFREWSLPMDDLSIELLKLRLHHALERVRSDTFKFPPTASPLDYVLSELWNRNSQAWLKEKETIALFSPWTKPGAKAEGS